MKWRATDDPDVIASGPYFIRRARSDRFVLGRRVGKHDECLGGFDTADEAREAAKKASAQRELPEA